MLGKRLTDVVGTRRADLEEISNFLSCSSPQIVKLCSGLQLGTGDKAEQELHSRVLRQRLNKIMSGLVLFTFVPSSTPLSLSQTLIGFTSPLRTIKLVTPLFSEQLRCKDTVKTGSFFKTAPKLGYFSNSLSFSKVLELFFCKPYIQLLGNYEKK